MKKTNDVATYMIPIFLWSTVVNQLIQPVVARGRLKKPRRAATAVAMLLSLFSYLYLHAIV